MSQFSDNVKSLMLQKGISQTDLYLRTGIGESKIKHKRYPQIPLRKYLSYFLYINTTITKSSWYYFPFLYILFL